MRMRPRAHLPTSPSITAPAIRKIIPRGEGEDGTPPFPHLPTSPSIRHFHPPTSITTSFFFPPGEDEHFDRFKHPGSERRYHLSFQRSDHSTGPLHGHRHDRCSRSISIGIGNRSDRGNDRRPPPTPLLPSRSGTGDDRRLGETNVLRRLES
jgi:hypothetical protein